MNAKNNDNDSNELSDVEKEKQKIFEEFMTKGANSNVAMVPQETTIRIAVELMIKYKISSVLVHDADEEILGILTEKDIVKKLTLLELDDKLDKKVLTLATRPVLFVNQQTYQEDIIKLHLEKRIHHFPVVDNQNPKTTNVVSLISIGDFLRKFFLAETTSEKDDQNKNISQELIELFFLNGSGERNSKSVRCLESLGVKIKRITNFHSFFQENKSKAPPIMFDIDSFPVKEAKNLVQALRKYHGPSIFITNNAVLVGAFRMHLNPELQVIVLKPIDYSYCYWLLKHKWKLN